MVNKTKSDKIDTQATVTRLKRLDTYRLLSLLPILPYHVVADIGCSSGHISLTLAKYVFDGKLYALDTQQEMLDTTKKALENVHLSNFELLLIKNGKLDIPDNVLDGAVMAFTLQESHHKDTLLKEVKRCLKKTGWLAILQETEANIDQEQLAKAVSNELGPSLEKAGLNIKNRWTFGYKQFLVLAGK